MTNKSPPPQVSAEEAAKKYAKEEWGVDNVCMPQTRKDFLAGVAWARSSPHVPAASGAPPRLFAVHHEISNGEEFWTAQEWRRINPAWDQKRHKTEYLSVQEHLALLSSARAAARSEAFREAANYLYTTDSSDEQHELIEQLARDLRSLADLSAKGDA